MIKKTVLRFLTDELKISRYHSHFHPLCLLHSLSHPITHTYLEASYCSPNPARILLTRNQHRKSSILALVQPGPGMSKQQRSCRGALKIIGLGSRQLQRNLARPHAMLSGSRYVRCFFLYCCSLVRASLVALYAAEASSS